MRTLKSVTDTRRRQQRFLHELSGAGRRLHFLGSGSAYIGKTYKLRNSARFVELMGYVRLGESLKDTYLVCVLTDQNGVRHTNQLVCAAKTTMPPQVLKKLRSEIEVSRIQAEAAEGRKAKADEKSRRAEKRRAGKRKEKSNG